MKVNEAMHKGVTWVPPTATVAEIAKRMREEDIGAVPVGENDRLIGMVTDRDIVCRGMADGSAPGKLTARDVMTEGIVVCREGDDIEEAVHLMESRKIRRLPVLNKDKRMVGMLSLGDVSGMASTALAGEMARAVSGHHG